MSIELRASLRSRAAKGAKRDARPDNRLSFFDQASFLSLRANGLGQLMQCVWIYEHDVDVDGLRRFHHNFGYGLYGRLIERSALPFGRHRWVSSLGPPSEIDFAEGTRPRADFGDWADEHAQLPIDPEWGPGWHLGVQRFTDGSTAVSLVGSHCLADGVGALLAIADAANGNTRDLGYPSPRSRTRLGAVVADARQTVRGAPEVARTLVAAAKLALRRRHDIARSRASRPANFLARDGDCNVVVPTVTICIDLDGWDARAKALGGTHYALFAGFAAKLGERLGRQRTDDGAVNLIIPISDRTQDDTRANAMPFANVSVDPAQVTTNLSGARVAIRQAIKTMREAPDETLQLLPLIPLIPRRAVTRLADAFLNSSDLPISCSNLGDLDPAVGRPDGTDAEYVILRGLNQHVTLQNIERIRGQLFLVSGRIAGKISIAVGAYQPCAENSQARLRELVAHTLAEFDLSGVIL